LTNKDKVLKFEPKARIIRAIGDQLISGPEAAVIELVKNSYDADASYVKIKFFPPLVAGQGRIEVSDDGHGMTIDDIRLKWMEPATASKIKKRISAKKDRPMMGSKGIGRFATAKLGAAMSLMSTSDLDNAETVLIPELDWSIFSEDVYLSDIEIDYTLQPAKEESHGTLIEVRELHESWDEEKLKKLYLGLRRLISPLVSKVDAKNKFDIYLDLSECTRDECGFDGTTIVESDPSKPNSDLHVIRPMPILSSCDYELIGRFDEIGNFNGTFQVKRAGRGPEKVTINVPAEELNAGPGAFDVHFAIFDREGDALKRSMREAGMGEMKVAQARKLLDSITGVSIYRSGFRIRPYGDEQNDWLALDTRRVNNPSMKIGRNQISGFISIAGQHNSNLSERSSREGFEENEAFERLTSLVLKLLDTYVEPKRYTFRQDAGLSRKPDTSFDEAKKLTELSKIKRMLSKLDLSVEDKAKVSSAIAVASEELSDRIDQLGDRQRVLEAQSSLGAIVGEVLHEGSPAARYIAEMSNWLSRRFPIILRPNDKEFEDTKSNFINKLSHIKKYGEKLNTLFIGIEPLSGGKRGKVEIFFPIIYINNAFELFNKRNVKLKTDLQVKGIRAIGYPEDLSTAMINIVGNAVHWLEDSKVKSPKVLVTISRSGKYVRIEIQDNGPGIREEFQDKIFDVGFSLREKGTGLGLNIAREALARSGAKLLFDQEYEKGAKFEILFPIKEVVK